MNGYGTELFGALLMEAFVTIHMSLFVLSPLSKLISKENSKKVFWWMFGIRIAILLFFDFFITPGISIVDFLLVFLGAFTVLPIYTIKSSKERIRGAQQLRAQGADSMNAQTISLNQTMGGTAQAGTAQAETKKALNFKEFDPLFDMSDKACLEEFIKREMQRVGITDTKNMIPEDMLHRKKILNIIFVVLLFVYVCLIFFHFPSSTYWVGLAILVVYSFFTGRFELMKYLKKEVTARPQEKVSNIVMNVKASLVPDNSKKIKAGMCVVAVALAIILFVQPRVFYEKTDGGYAVRFYAFGVTNMTSATIPDTYKGQKVVALRGNTFSNMSLLKEVELPDSITEIRGQAFKGCSSLESVTLPNELEYLGGGAFYECSALKKIDLPDSLEYLGGEAFYGCSDLEEVTLSHQLTEIRGNTFEECTSLKRIDLPDSVTRIGGHAFYDALDLEEVVISPESELKEIGSSAFRRCFSLEEITLPESTYVNERAFKETSVRVNYYYGY